MLHTTTWQGKQNYFCLGRFFFVKFEVFVLNPNQNQNLSCEMAELFARIKQNGGKPIEFTLPQNSLFFNGIDLNAISNYRKFVPKISVIVISIWTNNSLGEWGLHLIFGYKFSLSFYSTRFLAREIIINSKRYINSS